MPIATRVERQVLPDLIIDPQNPSCGDGRGTQKTPFGDGGGMAILRLPEGYDWHIQLFCTLFVRDFYDRFIVEQCNQFEGPGNVLVMGTPGIGKSSFGLYAITYALTLKKTVVYKHHSDPTIHYVFSPDQSDVRMISASTYPSELLNPQNVYVVDGVTPSVAKAFTLFVSSPNSVRVGEWSKQVGVLTYYFPSWTLQELSLLVQHCYPSKRASLTDDEIQRRMGAVGGNPRNIVNEEKWEARENAMDVGVPKAIIQFKTNQIKSADVFSTSHKIFELIVDRLQFRLLGLDFVSTVARDKLLGELADNEKEHLLRMLRASRGIPEVAVTSGTFFQNIVGRQLAKLGTVTVKKYDNDDASTIDSIVLPFPVDGNCTQVQKVEQIKRSSSDDPILWEMMPKNHPAVDYYLTKGREVWCIQVSTRITSYDSFRPVCSFT